MANLFDNVKDNINLYYMTHYLTFNIPPPTKKKSNLTKSFKINVKESLNHI